MPHRNQTGLFRQLPTILSCFLILNFPSPAWALPNAQAQSARQLKIVILEGEGAINNIRQRTAREPIVQVQDENDRPVAGAVVTFALPDRGASGVFANDATSMSVITDSQGRAVAEGLRPNSVTGEMQIRVTASSQGQTASAVITQTNSMIAGTIAGGAGGGSGKLITILAIAGGAVAGGVVAASRLGGNNGRTPVSPGPSPGAPTTIAAGTPTIGPPR